MTLNTNGDYIKPMLFCITFMMMILVCLFRTIGTFKGFGMRQFPCSNNNADFGASNIPFGMFHSMIKSCFTSGSFALFSLSILFVGFSAVYAYGISMYYFFAFFAISITFTINPVCLTLSKNSATELAITLKPIFSASFFIKLRKWLGFFTTKTSFYCNRINHNLSLFQNNIVYFIINRKNFLSRGKLCLMVYL